MVLSILGLCGYVGFTMLGIAGISIFHFSPGIGLILSILGCVGVLAGASRTKKTIAWQLGLPPHSQVRVTTN